MKWNSVFEFYKRVCLNYTCPKQTLQMTKSFFREYLKGFARYCADGNTFQPSVQI